MRVMRAVLSFAAALLLLANTSTYAATLLGVNGQALVNRGSGYGLAANGMELNPGDMVVVNSGGAALISYPDGCTVPVQVGAVVTITDISPCATMTTGAVEGPATGLNGTLLVTGAVVVAAGGVGLALALKSSKDKPASP